MDIATTRFFDPKPRGLCRQNAGACVMALPKRPPLPVILMANDLVDGEVVFRTANGWSSEFARGA